jgi:hypothetical protein
MVIPWSHCWRGPDGVMTSATCRLVEDGTLVEIQQTLPGG